LNKPKLHNVLPKKSKKPGAERRLNWPQPRKTMISLSLKRKLRRPPRGRKRKKRQRTLLSRPPRRPHKPKCSLLLTVLLLILM
jgi:hypothetical protein